MLEFELIGSSGICVLVVTEVRIGNGLGLFSVKPNYNIVGQYYRCIVYFDFCTSEETGSTYCMAEDSVRLEVGEWYLTSSCFNCSCYEDLMSCCG